MRRGPGWVDDTSIVSGSGACWIAEEEGWKGAWFKDSEGNLFAIGQNMSS